MFRGKFVSHVDLDNLDQQKLTNKELFYDSQGSILAFFQTLQPGKYARKDTFPDKILLARSKIA